MKKKDLAVIVIAIWLMIVSIFMLLAYQIDLEIFFVLWLIGLLVIVELMDTRFSLPPVYEISQIRGCCGDYPVWCYCCGESPGDITRMNNEYSLRGSRSPHYRDSS